ncbi:hypothetical protein KAS50_03915, partial [bacterium]|nr:hypothetical protein [bacterium]
GYVNLNDYVTDDRPNDEISWNAAGDYIAGAVIDASDSVTFNLVNAEQWGVQFVVFSATDGDNATGDDTMRVVVLADNIPTVWGIPDVTMQVGGSDNSIDLDDYVWDKDTPKENMTWTTSAVEHLVVSIDISTHQVTITSTDLGFVGEEDVIFRATDPEGHLREDIITVSVYPGDGTPFIKPLPEVNITKTFIKEIDLDDYLVIFPELLRDNIRWSVAGSMVNVVVTIDPNTHVASFKIGNNPNFLGSEPVTITATDTTSLKSDNQKVTVKVVQGDAPVLAPLPNITIISGTLDSTISLDPYVRDDDTEIKDLIWTVTGNNNVTVDESRLSKGSDHKLILGSQPDYIGKETLIIRVTDNEGYFDSDTIVVNVITLTELFLYAFPNPIEGE